MTFTTSTNSIIINHAAKAYTISRTAATYKAIKTTPETLINLATALYRKDYKHIRTETARK